MIQIFYFPKNTYTHDELLYKPVHHQMVLFLALSLSAAAINTRARLLNDVITGHMTPSPA